MTLLTLIICTYQRPEPLRRLLTALARQTRRPDRILVVDASSTTASATACQDLAASTGLPGLEYHAVPAEARGLTRQRNRGIVLALQRQPGGSTDAAFPIIAFLDDDTVPEPAYCEQLMACFARHPDAVGVGGMIINDARWRQERDARPPMVPATAKAVNRFGSRSGRFHWNNWSFPEDPRRRLRHRLGLSDDQYPPGWMPPDGHGRSVAFYPPDGEDYPVEYVLGCAMAFRPRLFASQAPGQGPGLRFSETLAGYALYEDLEFCLRATQTGPLFFCTRARLAHEHAPGGRPRWFAYGTMVVRNGWRVWRLRWPKPSRAARCRWWTISLLLAACRLLGCAPGAVKESAGRLWCAIELLLTPEKKELQPTKHPVA